MVPSEENWAEAMQARARKKAAGTMTSYLMDFMSIASPF
jgi:hypothetical protein